MLQMKINAELLLVLRILTFPPLWLNPAKPPTPSATYSFASDFSKGKFVPIWKKSPGIKFFIIVSASIKAKEKQ